MRKVQPPASAGPQAVPTADDRIMSLDVLRGIALFGILMVNMAHFALPTMYLSGAHMTLAGGPLDHVADGLDWFFGQGKFFPLFSFLFGLGLAIQFLSWQAKGAETTRLFLRRLSCLLGIGLCHGLLIWAGDILTKYALLGLIFIFALRLPPRYLLVGAAGMLALPLALGGLGVDDALTAAAGLPQSPAEYRALAEHATAAYTSGSFLEMTAQRAHDVAYRYTAWPYASGLFTIVCMFCLGAYAGRTGLFRAPVGPKFRRIGAACLAVWAASLGYMVLADAVPAVAVPQLGKVAKLAWNLSTTGLYIAGVVLLLEGAPWRRRLAPLAQTGRMALTNYLMQSVVATAFFYGAGWYGKLGPAACLAVTFVIYGLQVAWSNVWMKHFRFGPVEWLWRWVTYGKRPPMRRPAKAPQPLPELAGSTSSMAG